VTAYATCGQEFATVERRRTYCGERYLFATPHPRPNRFKPLARRPTRWWSHIVCDAAKATAGATEATLRVGSEAKRATPFDATLRASRLLARR
jgi:hypothetical protein